ncbi:MAG: arginine kinase [Chloroflexi bacterium]|nr:arginine kinase [Chloroflexota bacterium]
MLPRPPSHVAQPDDQMLVCTPNGITWRQICKSGLENPDSKIGFYAGDAESYEIFWEQLRSTIIQYHQVEFPDHLAWQPDQNFLAPMSTPPLAPVRTTRLRVARNLAGRRFPPAMNGVERQQVYQLVKESLQATPGVLLTLDELTESQKATLAASRMLFDNQDRFMASANILDDWPIGRAIFISADGSSGVWINEEDHLRIISIVPGYNLPKAVEAVTTLLTALESRLAFAWSNRLGWLTSCPSNLGTGLRASVRAECSPAEATKFRQLGLQLRGDQGEHTTALGSVYDISPQQRLGLTEYQIMDQLNEALCSVFAASETL